MRRADGVTVSAAHVKIFESFKQVSRPPQSLIKNPLTSLTQGIAPAQCRLALHGFHSIGRVSIGRATSPRAAADNTFFLSCFNTLEILITYVFSIQWIKDFYAVSRTGAPEETEVLVVFAEEGAEPAVVPQGLDRRLQRLDDGKPVDGALQGEYREPEHGRRQRVRERDLHVVNAFVAVKPQHYRALCSSHTGGGRKRSLQHVDQVIKHPHACSAAHTNKIPDRAAPMCLACPPLPDTDLKHKHAPMWMLLLSMRPRCDRAARLVHAANLQAHLHGTWRNVGSRRRPGAGCTQEREQRSEAVAKASHGAFLVAPRFLARVGSAMCVAHRAPARSTRQA